jgi:hypothetical protein
VPQNIVFQKSTSSAILDLNNAQEKRNAKIGKALLNHQQHTVAAYCGYDLANHHHALADAEA